MALKPATLPAPAPTKLPPPDPTPVSADIVVDSQLVNATLVTASTDKHEPDAAKTAPAAVHSGLEVEQAASDPSAPPSAWSTASGSRSTTS